jgi:hypothetical protein
VSSIPIVSALLVLSLSAPHAAVFFPDRRKRKRRVRVNLSVDANVNAPSSPAYDPTSPSYGPNSPSYEPTEAEHIASIKQDLLTCVACRDILCKPYSLQCSHVVCCVCFDERSSDSTNLIRCPSCGATSSPTTECNPVAFMHDLAMSIDPVACNAALSRRENKRLERVRRQAALDRITASGATNIHIDGKTAQCPIADLERAASVVSIARKAYQDSIDDQWTAPFHLEAAQLILASIGHANWVVLTARENALHKDMEFVCRPNVANFQFVLSGVRFYVLNA